jgi:hypothetical protein
MINMILQISYMGVSVPSVRMKRGRLQTIEERFVKRMNDWNERTLSQVAKGSSDHGSRCASTSYLCDERLQDPFWLM